MSKRKKRKREKSGAITLSPKTYIKTKARQLPIHKCFISDDWEDTRMPEIFVARIHKSGHISCGVYLVDMLCFGIKDTFFSFNMTQHEYEQFREDFILKKCDYALAHNIIYGAVEFAQKCGFQPHKDFSVTQYILEDPGVDIKAVKIEFGEDGVPTVVATLEDEPKHIIAQLEKTVGPDNYKVVYLDGFGFDDEYDDETEDEEEPLPADPFEMIDELYEQKFGKQSGPDVNPATLELRQYKISFEPVEKPNYFSPEEDMRKAEKLYYLASSGSARKAIPKLKTLMKKFPNNPIYYNYLIKAYENSGDQKAAEQVCEYSYQRFPDYLFARCNYAQYLLKKEKTEKIPEVFDNKFELQSIYPERDEFHISEVLAFFSIMCRYFTAIDELTTANVYGDLLKEFDDIDSPPRDFALSQLRAKKYEKVFGALLSQ